MLCCSDLLLFSKFIYIAIFSLSLGRYFPLVPCWKYKEGDANPGGGDVVAGDSPFVRATVVASASFGCTQSRGCMSGQCSCVAIIMLMVFNVSLLPLSVNRSFHWCAFRDYRGYRRNVGGGGGSYLGLACISSASFGGAQRRECMFGQWHGVAFGIRVYFPTYSRLESRYIIVSP